jgi:hypothetical protein
VIKKPIDQIEKSDIEQLVSDQVPEGLQLDYKEALPGDSREEKRELLCDVSAFANTSGGDLIYGIVERRDDGKPTGVPERIAGLSGVNADQETLRIQSIIRDGIEPTLLGVQVKSISGFGLGPVIIVRVMASWARLHMVTPQGSGKGNPQFYGRHSGGKHRLDVHEIRAGFLASESQAVRIRNFRAERLSMILAGDTPVPLRDWPKTVLHIYPASALTNLESVDVVAVREKSPTPFRPIGDTGYGGRFNLDGVLFFDRRADGRSCGYTQVFRSGAVEAVDAWLLSPREDESGRVDRFIPSGIYERDIAASVGSYLRGLHAQGIEPPAIIMLTLLGVLGYSMSAGGIRRLYAPKPIERRDLLLPDVLVTGYEEQPTAFMKPAFDALWQSCDWPGSQNYNENGEWDPKW